MGVTEGVKSGESGGERGRARERAVEAKSVGIEAVEESTGGLWLK